MLSLLICSVTSLSDGRENIVNPVQGDVQHSRKLNMRKVSETSDVKIENFTFYNFSTYAFDTTKKDRMLDYSVTQTYTMAIWFGDGEGPILTMSHKHEKSGFTYTDYAVNTVITPRTTTGWIFPTMTEIISVSTNFGTQVIVVTTLLAVMTIIVGVIGAMTDWSIINWIFSLFVKQVHVHKHRSHHHNWNGNAAQTTPNTVPSRATGNLNSSLITETPAQPPINSQTPVPPKDDPYGDDYSVKEQPKAQPGNPQPNAYDANPYAQPMQGAAPAMPGAAPAMPGGVPPPVPGAQMADPYADAPVATPPPPQSNEANPDDDW